MTEGFSWLGASALPLMYSDNPGESVINAKITAPSGCNPMPAHRCRRGAYRMKRYRNVMRGKILAGAYEGIAGLQHGKPARPGAEREGQLDPVKFGFRQPKLARAGIVFGVLDAGCLGDRE